MCERLGGGPELRADGGAAVASEHVRRAGAGGCAQLMGGVDGADGWDEGELLLLLFLGGFVWSVYVEGRVCVCVCVVLCSISMVGQGCGTSASCPEQYLDDVALMCSVSQ